MTEVDGALAPELAPPRLDDPPLDVGFKDVLVALVTFCGSLAVLAYGLGTFAVFPVFYSIFVLDLKWIKWETTGERQEEPAAEPATT